MWLLSFALLAIIAVNASQTVEPQTVLEPLADAESFCTSSDGKYRLSPFDKPVLGNGSPGSLTTWKLTVDDTRSGHQQKISGFGATVTDSTVSTFNKLPPASLSQLLKTFLTGEGANFAIMRHTIGASDLSGDPAYTYDDNDGKADPSLKDFRLGDRGDAMAATLKKMRDVNPALYIFGSPWTPPGWMKLNGKLWGPSQNNTLNPKYVSQWTEYFVRYLQAYKTAGASIDAITIQNEPLRSGGGTPTMYVSAGESGKLINDNIGPALKKTNMPTKIWAYDHNTNRADYPTTVLQEASQFIDAVAWHCYANPNNWTVLSEFHRHHPAVDQYMTECWTSATLPWTHVPDFTMGPLQNRAAGVVAWALGTDTNNGPHLSYPDGPCTKCRGLVVIDTAAGTYSLTLDYYLLAQFSRFMPRGATALAGTGSRDNPDGSGLQAVASLNPDGTKSVVMENKNAGDVYVTVTLESGRVWSGRVHAKSVTTWMLPK